jgi:hypothetical protein
VSFVALSSRASRRAAPWAARQRSATDGAAALSLGPLAATGLAVAVEPVVAVELGVAMG